MQTRPRFLLETEGGSSGTFTHAQGLEGQLFHHEAIGPGRLISFLHGRIHGTTRVFAEKQGRTSENATVTFLDLAGNHLFSHFLGPVTVCRIFQSDQDGFISELVLSADDFEPLTPGLSEVLSSWEDGIPMKHNQWSVLSYHGRRAWLSAVSARQSCFSDRQSRTSHYVLDSTHIADYPGLFLALGEAINGPCGYYGKNLDAVEDCLAGGFGATPPFTLAWRGDNKLSEDAWDREQFWRDQDRSCERANDFTLGLDLAESLIEVLRTHSVSVTFDTNNDE